MFHIPQWFVGFDSIMQIAESIIAFGVGYYAFKGYRLIKDRTLFFLHFSFILLGVGLITDGLVSMPWFAFRGLSPVMAMGYFIRITAEIIAYVLLLFAYLRQTRSFMADTALLATAAYPFLLLEILQYHPLLEITVFFLIAFIATQTALNYGVRKDRNSLLVLIGFVLLAISHVFFILPPYITVFFVIAHLTQLFGFLALLAMLLRVTRTK
jgi:hypothetical protein